jgi:hypothetical protein
MARIISQRERRRRKMFRDEAIGSQVAHATDGGQYNNQE